MIFLGSATLYYFLNGIPDYREIDKHNMPISTRIFSSNGIFLSEQAKEKRFYIPINNIPPQLINAFIATEDRSFYNNYGVDFAGIFRALMHNISRNKNSSLIGGSTITQQLVKNILLGPEKTLKRKAQEIILSFRIGKNFSKDKIMELYLNKIYFGHGAYGVSSAASIYFNKTINDLTLGEQAMLAALPQAPSRLDPMKNMPKSLQRRNWVLDKMAECDYITNHESMIAKSQSLQITKKSQIQASDSEFFIEEVRRKLLQEYGHDKLYKEGLFVRTTLLPEYQTMATNALIAGLRKYDKSNQWNGPIAYITPKNWKKQIQEIPIPAGLKEWSIATILTLPRNKNEAAIGLKDGRISTIKDISWAQGIKVGDVIPVSENEDGTHSIEQIPEVNGAIVAMDPRDGRILAMVGGYDYEKSQFNVATQAKRQPGSSFKPFVYLAALENGFSPNTIISDEAIEFYNPETQEIWAPKNMERRFFGPTTFRIGLEFSRNIVTLQIGQTIGIDKIRRIAKRFQIYEDTENFNYSTLLGSNETTLLDMVTAYSSLANSGLAVQHSIIEEIKNRDGKAIFKRDTRKCPDCIPNNEILENLMFPEPPTPIDNRKRIADESVVYQTISLLEGTVLNGYSRKSNILKIPLAAKTGTSNECKDAWFIGFTPEIVLGVYVGFDNPKTLGEKATGAIVALPIFVDFMQQYIEKNKTSIPFKVPPKIKLLNIDRTTGFLPNQETKEQNIILESFLENTEPTIQQQKQIKLLQENYNTIKKN